MKGRNGLRIRKLSFNHKPINFAILFPAIMMGITVFIAYFSHAVYPIPESIIEISKTITFILITLLLAGITAKIAVSIILKRFDESFEPEQKILASKLYVALIYLISLLIIFWQIGITIQNIALFLTLFATGLAFAIRDVIISYLAWYVLLTKKPFRIGDHIRIDEYEGKVEHIGTFYVIIDEYPETYDDFVRVPNKLFLEKPIRVYGRESYENTIEYPLQTIPENFEELRLVSEDLIEKETGKKYKIWLSSNKEKMVLRVTFKCSYKERHMIRDKIVLILAKNFK